MRKRFARTTILLAASFWFLLVQGCDNFNPWCQSCLPVPPNEYAQPTAPESLLVNLQASYRRREIGRYAELLAPEFRFYFQPVDTMANGESWDADQDSSGTDSLFRTNQVSVIRIELIYGPSEIPTDAGFAPDVRKIRINQVQLELDQIDGTTLLVTDPQDMYFRPGRAAAGEDTTRWYLLEWRDLPSAGAPKLGATRATTWGSIKARFLAGN